MSAENKAMVRRLMEAINDGNLDVVDELFTPELARPMKRSFIAFRSAFPDWRMEIAELVAEGNTVVGRFRCSGTNQGEYKGSLPRASAWRWTKSISCESKTGSSWTSGA